MADTAQVTFTDHDGTATSLFTNNLKIHYVYDGLTVSRKPGKIGITTDPVQVHRVITCTAILSGDALDTMDAQFMDVTKVYDGTDPKVVIYWDGDSTETIYVALTDVMADIVTNGQWSVSFTFTERSS